MKFNVEDHVLFVTLHGSHAYGMARESSDVDLKGVLVPPKSYFLGFSDSFGQFEGEFPRDFKTDGMTFIEKIEKMIGRKIGDDEKTDSSIYGIQKFFKLASDNNPNIIEILFTDPSHHVITTPLWEKILEHRDLFLSTRTKFSFSGYAFSQLKRIKTHRSWLLNPLEVKPQRSDFNLLEQHVIPKEQRDAAESFIRKKVNEWIFLPDEVPKDILSSVKENTAKALLNMWEGLTQDCYKKVGDEFIPIVPPVNDMGLIEEEELFNAAGNFLGYSTNFLEVLDRERRYKTALRQYNQYQEWKRNRNPIRAKMEAESGFDRKHASHLVRLLRMSKEIMTEGKVIVKRPDAEELLQIRDGAWSYDELIEWADKQQEEIDQIYKDGTSPLPKVPKIEKLNKLCEEIVEEAMKG